MELGCSIIGEDVEALLGLLFGDKPDSHDEDGDDDEC